ncbi:MAG: hypothetical protein M3280_10170 [Actinomycetota bacterium]|nr:hypothetical protein [Actinomycetota bacterium]
MGKKGILVLAAAAALVVQGFVLPAPAREQLKDCREIPVKTQSHDIHVAGQHIHIGGKSNPRLCVFWEREISGTPTITFYKNCGEVCFAVRLADVAVYSDVEVEVSYSEDGVRKSIPVHPSSIDLTKSVEEVCYSNHGEGSADPCTNSVTTPANLFARGRTGKVVLKWDASTPYNSNESVAGYEIWRSATGEVEDFQHHADSTGTKFIDTSVSAGTAYSYYVVAVGSNGSRSGGSNTATATPR